MIKVQSVKKYIVPAVFATSLAVFSPVFIDSASAHGAPDMEDNATTNTATTQTENNNAVILTNMGVEELQQKLTQNGQNLAVDGINGSETGQAVKNFQSNQGLQVDGIVGVETAQALNASSDEGQANESATNESNDIEITETNSNESTEATETTSATPVATQTSASTTSANASASDIVATAQSLVGTPYVFGGTDPNVGLDSSGFINAVFKEQGISLSRTHAGMWANDGVSVSNPQPGDVVFFAGTYQSGVSHSGIYLGNNQMIHAGTEATGVEVTDMGIDYWSSKYIGAKRFN